MLVLAAQPRHRLHHLVAVPDLDDIGMDAGFDGVAHQLRGHGVRPMRDANRAPPSHDRVDSSCSWESPPRAARAAPARSSARRRRRGPIAPAVDDVLDEGVVRGDVVEGRMAPHEQRLRDQRLQAAMRLLGDAVFMRPPRRDAARAHAVVLEHGAKARSSDPGHYCVSARGSRPTNCRCAGRPVPRRAPTARLARPPPAPQTSRRTRSPPTSSGCNCSTNSKSRCGNGSPAIVTPRSVACVKSIAASRPGHGDLLEEHLGLDAVPRPPVAKPPLQRPRLARMKLLRVARPQHLQHPLRFEHALRVAPQERLDVGGPDRRKRIRVASANRAAVSSPTAPAPCPTREPSADSCPLSAAAASCVLPSIRFCLMSRTCASVTIDHRLGTAGRPTRSGRSSCRQAADLIVAAHAWSMCSRSAPRMRSPRG